MVQCILEAIFENSTPPTQAYVTHTAIYVSSYYYYVSAYYRLMSMVERVLGAILRMRSLPLKPTSPAGVPILVRGEHTLSFRLGSLWSGGRRVRPFG